MQVANQIMKIKILRLFKIFAAGTCCKIQPNKKFDGNSNSYTEFVPSVRKIVNESGELHQEQARLYQQNYSPLLESSQQQQQTSNIHQHQTMSQNKRKCLEQQLNPSATDFHIQREHNFISPKNSFRRELRNSKESVNFNQRINSSLFIALMNLQQKTSFSLSQKIKIS